MERTVTNPLSWNVKLDFELLEIATIPLGGEHRRRPIRHAQDAGLAIQRHDRFTLGIVEPLAANKTQA